MQKNKREQTKTDSLLANVLISSAFFKDLLPGLKWASTKAMMELLGARLRTRTLIKSLCTSDFLNNSLSWEREREREREREDRQRGEMINEVGNELHAIVAPSPIPEDCTRYTREERPLKLGCSEETGCGCTNWHLAAAMALIIETSFQEELR